MPVVSIMAVICILVLSVSLCSFFVHKSANLCELLCFISRHVRPTFVKSAILIMFPLKLRKIATTAILYLDYETTNTDLANSCVTWWRHQMETFSALLAFCAGNSLVPGEFPAQRPVTRSFDVFFDLRPNKQLSKQWWGWWFETSSCPLWRHRNV